jgi:NAD+ synthase (glutamine-hydrolysing)
VCVRAFRVGLAQINTAVGDIDGNTRHIIDVIARARGLGVDVVAFPELAVPGYPPEDLLLKPDFVRGNVEALDAIGRATTGIAAVVGFVDPVNHREPVTLRNAAAVFVDGHHAGTYHKRRLPNYGVFDEKRYFTPGEACPVFDLEGVGLGVTICEDIWYPGGPTAVEARAGALIVVNINGSPYHKGKWREREDMLADRARAYGVAIAYVNLVGGQDELVFDGASVVVGPDGAIAARGATFDEDLVVCDLDVAVLRRAREAHPRRPSTHPGEGARAAALSVSPLDDALPAPRVTCPPLPARPQPASPARIATPPGPVEEVYGALVLGLRDYVRKNGFTDVVLGLSGGIDSALVAAIAADALGADRVHGAFMPSPYTSEDSRRLVDDLVTRLGVQTADIEIAGIFAAFREALAPAFAGRTADVTEENIQARIRGTLLMALSNKFGWLLLSTGNKSEYSCGYATLYGDMAGGFALIKDVPKTLVYALARWRNAAGEIIPPGIIARAPTAELRPGQKDTDSLPPYDVLDPILKLYVEDDVPPDDIIAQGHDAATVARVVGMVDRSEYKRRQAAPGVKITPKAFGRDRRLPITNRYQSARRVVEALEQRR